MATQVQFRRGTTTEHNSFTGAAAEVTVDTTLDTLRVHDGSTAGGVRIAKFSEIPSTFNFILEADDSAGVPINTDGTGTLRFAAGGENITTSSDSAGTIVITGATDITANNIASSDSTAIQINDAVNISGVLSVNNIDTNNIQSGDSTGVVVNDILRINGTISAVDSTSLVVQDALEVNGALTVAGASTVAALTASGTVTHNAATVYSVQDDLATSTTALSLTKTIHSLAGGETDYTLAAGTEGQIMHFVVAGGSSTANEVALTAITVAQTRNPRDGDVLATHVWQPFITGNDELGDSTVPQRTLATCIFANGAWNLDFFTKI